MGGEGSILYSESSTEKEILKSRLRRGARVSHVGILEKSGEGWSYKSVAE